MRRLNPVTRWTFALLALGGIYWEFLAICFSVASISQADMDAAERTVSLLASSGTLAGAYVLWHWFQLALLGRLSFKQGKQLIWITLCMLTTLILASSLHLAGREVEEWDGKRLLFLYLVSGTIGWICFGLLAELFLLPRNPPSAEAVDPLP